MNLNGNADRKGVKEDGSQEKSSEEEKGSKEDRKEEKEIRSLHTRTQQKRLGKVFPSLAFLFLSNTILSSIQGVYNL